MPARPLKYSLICLLGLSLLVTGCSRIGLAYRNLDALVPWWVNDYVDLDPQQKDWLDQRLAEHLEWHCRTELPAYLDWLDQSDQLLGSGRTGQQQVAAQLEALSGAQRRVADRLSPTLVELVRGLSAEQVADLQASIHDKHQELRDKYLEPPLPEQIEQRQERLEKRLKPWFGGLNPAQQTRIRSWSQGQGEQNRLWLEDRARWQAELFAALQQRQAADFPQRLQRLLAEPETLQDDQYRVAFQHSRQAFIGLFSDLIKDARPDQLEHLRARLRQVRQDFSELRCGDRPALVVKDQTLPF
ncbi:MAG: DUF6279 family lipoprotein [Pseudomonas sp.]|uniref:DUF6279 family lipoprotein n=1 Tax=Pseudomonas sp. TaxID=306 RepID=UPI0033911208